MNTLQKLDEHLQKSNVYDDIRRLLSEQKGGGAGKQVDNALQILQGRTASTRPALARGKRYLVLRVNTGQHFVNSLVNKGVEGDCCIRLSVYFGKHMFQSAPVAYTVDPPFNETFFLPLQEEHDASPLVSLDTLATSKRLLHLLLVKEDKQGRQSLLAFQRQEWRNALVTGSQTLNVELLAGDDFRHPVGLLNLELEVRPLVRPGKSKSGGQQVAVFVEQKELTAQLEKEKTLMEDVERQFYIYAKVN